MTITQRADHFDHVGRRDLGGRDRAGEACDDTETSVAVRDDGTVEIAEAVVVRVDGAAQVGLDRQAQPAGDRRIVLVRVDEDDRAGTGHERGGQADRDLGDPAATRPRDDDEVAAAGRGQLGSVLGATVRLVRRERPELGAARRRSPP